MKTIFMIAALMFVSATSFANTYSYNCYSYYWNGYEHQEGTMTLEVSADGAKANIVEEMWDDGELGGALNPNYKSKSSLKFVKFGNLILEEALVSGGKQLKDGSLGGIARVEGQAEGGFYQYKFICKR